METACFEARSNIGLCAALQRSDEHAVHGGTGPGCRNCIEALAVKPFREDFGHTWFHRHELKIGGARNGCDVHPPGCRYRPGWLDGGRR